MGKDQHLLDFIKSIPLKPGVYRYFNAENDIIYVGKAKKLRNRVSSYFQQSANHSLKTKRMVAQIDRIEYTVVDTEFDALLLENSLIKTNSPKYNIMLRDDKTYPYIIITKDRFPRIESTRKVEPGKGEYFGPYSSVIAMKNVLKMIHKTYGIRTCTFNLSEENVTAKKHKVCLEFHIGNCFGPCEAKQTEEDYLNNVQQARNILKGDIQLAKSYFQDKMQQHAGDLQFEKAEVVKAKLDTLQKFQDRSIVANPKFKDLDVFTIKSDENKSFVNYLKIQKGTITASKNLEIKSTLDETEEEKLSLAIIELRESIESKSDEIVSNIEVPSLSEYFLITVPKIGDKRKLVELSIKNLLEYKRQRNPKPQVLPWERVLNTLQADMRLKDLPLHIECFDNSNIQGSNPVASMVCFKKGKPAKKEYRHFKIKTVEGPNDFDSMKEIVYRRYSRLVSEGQSLPQLIVIDGGKGQLSSAMESIRKVGIETKVTVVGIAKRLEEIYYPGDNDPLFISKKSESLKLLQHVRNEAHRFAITFHRKKRSDNFLNSELEGIEGIGPNTIKKLLTEFKTISKIKIASKEELTAVIGQAKTSLLTAHFNQK